MRCSSLLPKSIWPALPAPVRKTSRTRSSNAQKIPRMSFECTRPRTVISQYAALDGMDRAFLRRIRWLTAYIVFTKLGSRLSVDKLTDLAIIPVIFVIQTFVSYISSCVASRCFRFKRRQSNFVTGHGRKLILSLARTLELTSAFLLRYLVTPIRFQFP